MKRGGRWSVWIALYTPEEPHEGSQAGCVLQVYTWSLVWAKHINIVLRSRMSDPPVASYEEHYSYRELYREAILGGGGGGGG